MFVRIGGFDNELISGFVSILSIKAKKLGYSICYVSEAIVYHPVDGLRKRLR